MAESELIDLSGSIDISQAAQLHAQLASCLSNQIPVVFNAAATERVDGAILQVLCAFLGAAEVAGLDCRWQGVSPALASVADLTGLTNHLKLGAVGSASAGPDS